jgi:nucleoside-diphosphate-sugar epimerase
MRVCVVGATGVVGRSLVPLLLGRGYDVLALARSPQRASPLSEAGAQVERFDLLEIGEAGRLSELLSGCSAVVHAATAIPRDLAAPGAWDDNTRLRTEGTRLTLEASLSAGVDVYLQQSITLTYPDGGERWLEEDTPFDTSPERAEVVVPVRVMETQVRSVDPGRLRWCVLRAGMLVGPGTAQEATIARLVAGKERVPGGGCGFLSLVHVVDFAAAIADALEHAPGGSVFNVVDEPVRQGEYLKRLARLVGAAPPPRGPSEEAGPPSQRSSNRRAREALGWRPKRGVWPEPGSGMLNFRKWGCRPANLRREAFRTTNHRRLISALSSWETAPSG